MYNKERVRRNKKRDLLDAAALAETPFLRPMTSANDVDYLQCKTIYTSLTHTSTNWMVHEWNGKNSHTIFPPLAISLSRLFPQKFLNFLLTRAIFNSPQMHCYFRHCIFSLLFFCVSLPTLEFTLNFFFDTLILCFLGFFFRKKLWLLWSLLLAQCLTCLL